MPATLDGFGTTYTKHSNEHGWAATCRTCGREERLTSFDTYEAVALMFVPVVKPKALRVVGSCPNCTRHRAMPRKSWRSALDEISGTAKASLTREGATVQIELENTSSATRTRVSLAAGGLQGALEAVDRKSPALGTSLLKARLAFDPADAEAQRALAGRL